MRREVDLNLLKPGKLDLSDYAAHVLFTGNHIGGQLVIDSKSASNKTLVFKDASITLTDNASDHAAIVFDGELKNCKIHADNCRLIYGGLTFTDRLQDVQINGLHISYPLNGIVAILGQESADVTVENCVVIGAKVHGVWIGSSALNQSINNNITIRNNWILASGFTAIQCTAKPLQIHNNLIEHPAMLQVQNQDYAISIRPGSEAYVWDNEILTEGKVIQSLDCCFFDHPPQNTN